MYTKSEPIFFVENIKMSDVILTNTLLLDILPHFGIVNLGWNNKTVKEVCDENNVSVSLFLLICNLYTFDEYSRSNQESIKQMPVREVIKYLQKAHKYIRKFRLSQIRDVIINLENHYHSILGNIMSDAGVRYERMVVDHIKYEEEVVFPYIIRLLNGEQAGSYGIHDYDNDHVNIEIAISDLRHIIINYLPQCTIAMCRGLLFSLFMFEYALCKHRLIENTVLVPLAANLEKKLCNLSAIK
jgi:regulator of cell morphogenesis and NO signaling